MNMTRSEILTKPVDLIFLDSRKTLWVSSQWGVETQWGGGARGRRRVGESWKAGVGYQSGQPAMTWKTRFFLSVHKPKKL
jgi:hypothetical protein